MKSDTPFSFETDAADVGRRFDHVVTLRLGTQSRSRIGALIREGWIRAGGEIRKPGYRLKSGDNIEGRIPPPPPTLLTAEPIPLTILYQDRHIIVIDKPAGLVVHPAPGNLQGTLVNALLHQCPDIEGIGGEGRPGIVHRLDKQTTGVMVVAKNMAAHRFLSRQFKDRRITKHYAALVYGEMSAAAGTIRLPIGRHPVDRKKMSTAGRRGRAAETRWTVRERFRGATLLDLLLKTGRTHQIRVHCAAIHHPVVGDPVYGGRKHHTPSGTVLERCVKAVDRQMLHARQLGFLHPGDETFVTFAAPLPPDMQAVLKCLAEER